MRITITVSLEDKLVEELKKEADKENMSLSRMIENKLIKAQSQKKA